MYPIVAALKKHRRRCPADVARSKSSSRWLKEHHEDRFVRQARAEGLRSRAVYKLMELDNRHRLFKPGMTVVDLGAAPGGWSEYAVQRVGRQGRVVAIDILPMDPIAGVSFVQGDFSEPEGLTALEGLLGEARGVDLVLSDMAPNISGIRARDQARAMYLVELALEFAVSVLKPNGCFLTKLFQGEGSDAFMRVTREHFRKVQVRKPEASRDRSREVYLLGSGFGT